MKQHSFKINDPAWKGRPILLDRAETTAEAIESGHFTSDEVLADAAEGWRFISISRLFKDMREENPDVTPEELRQAGNALRMGERAPRTGGGSRPAQELRDENAELRSIIGAMDPNAFQKLSPDMYAKLAARGLVKSPAAQVAAAEREKRAPNAQAASKQAK